MNGKAVLVQGGLALVGLAAAYVTWQRQPELQAGEVFVLDLTKNELDKVRFDDEDAKTWVELQRESDNNGSFVALRLSERGAPGAKTTDSTPAASKRTNAVRAPATSDETRICCVDMLGRPMLDGCQAAPPSTSGSLRDSTHPDRRALSGA